MAAQSAQFPGVPSLSPVGGAIIRQFHETLRRTQFMPPDALKAYQLGLLDSLVRHARAHVPFYRDSGRLEPLFRSGGAVDWQRWMEIPPLRRADLQQDYERLKSDVIPPSHGRLFVSSTSGSTGEPVKVLQTELAARWAWFGQRLRDYEWHGIDPTRRLAFVYPFTDADFDTGGVRWQPSWRPEFMQLGLKGERVDIADNRPIADVLAMVLEARPDYILVHPTTLELMIAHDAGGRLVDLGLAAVLTYGEHFPPEQKRRTEHRLGCKVVESFGSSECGTIAGSCPRCNRFHVQAEVVVVDIVGEDGAPTQVGETGRALITPLYGYAMPLIRYDQGDFAQVGAPDGCDIRLPVLDLVFGKRRVPFWFGGRTLRPSPPADAIVDFLGARMFQIAQVALDRCEVRFVPGSRAPADMRFDDMTELLRAMWWRGLQVDYRVVESLPRRTARSKIETLVQEVPELAVKFGRQA